MRDRHSGSSVAVRGRLRVNVDAFFSRLLFTPHISEFLSLYPNLSLELIARDKLGDLVGEGFDIAVRFGTPPESSWWQEAARDAHDHGCVAGLSGAARQAGRSIRPRPSCLHPGPGLIDGQPIEAWQFRQKNKVVDVRTTAVSWWPNLARCSVPAWECRDCEVKSDRCAAPHPTGRFGRTSWQDWPGESYRLRAVPVSPPARSQGARLHRLCSVTLGTADSMAAKRPRRGRGKGEGIVTVHADSSPCPLQALAARQR